ncbi:asparagine synthase (glutamine-hydrolyzing) [Allosphingosinicella deserti]|uniref:asparagine synthase (glutamine-hydrolyzing) n=1 Tax=Allosphingosinicella deserti TaxID=2116704 RepID=A0A2P7QUT8_9SPHN|nr:asparagine synthase (glutamine-hydrolyzing) [Sphingomonas deserti]PSJ41732.1 asparagine synthase (glutamine-hydrolyzing) [Sphingomonas deserti]
MCGLAGILGTGGRSPQLLEGMGGAIAHRGPDDQGLWQDEEAGIGLAHRRLSIVDLSPMGHQPMASADGQWVIAYNGEIYNHMRLRAELDQVRPIAWRGHSDTETLIEAIATWGLHDTLVRAVGMFAIALWDRRTRTLQLARDRFGEKPLYYGWVGSDFVFGSELKAIRKHPGFNNPIDRNALRLLGARAYIPAPFSIYEHLYKLEPGCILTVANGAAAHRPSAPPVEGESGGISLTRYWSYRRKVLDGLADPIESSEEALERLEATLADAVAGQAVADVPVGAFLSGGIDSSTIVALYQKHAPGRVKTFSIGFEDAGFDEAVYAKSVARHFGTEHHERYVSAHEAQEVIPLLPRMYDEPFADSSQIPTHLVSRLAREHVTVSLSGDGGDELFGGYNRYIATSRLWSKLKRLPRPVRGAIGAALATVPPSGWNGLAALLPSGRRPAFFGTKVHKLFGTMRDCASLEDLVDTFLDEWAGKASPVLPHGPLPALGRYDMTLAADSPDVTRMMYADAVSYLPDDILCKVDRAGMAVSLESRIPFLDHRVAELAARIPLSMKIEGGSGKQILKRLLYKHAPQEMFDRPKAGFAVPVGEWLKGPMRPWAESLLDPRVLRDGGHFDPAMVQQRWRSHLAGEKDSTQALWTVLMFQSWLTDAQSADEAETPLVSVAAGRH